ncbi:MAG: ATP-binding protein [Bacteroidia bacterium]
MKHYQWLILIYLLCGFFSVYAEIPEALPPGAAVLTDRLATEKSEEKRMETYGELAKLYFFVNTDKCHEYATKAYELSLKVKNKSKQCYFLKIMGSSRSMSGDYVSAILDYQQALIIGRSIQDTALIDIHTAMGIAYTQISDYDDALYHFNRGIVLSDSMQMPWKAAAALGCIGHLYAEKGNFQHAIPETRKGLRLAEKQQHFRLMAYGYKDMAYSFTNLGYQDSALFYIKKALDISSNQKNFPFISGESYVVLGQIYQKAGLYDSALIAAQEAKNLEKQIMAKKIAINAEELFARIYLETNQWDKARTHAQEMLAIATEAKYTMLQKTASELLATIYQRQGEFKNAAEYFHLAGELANEIYQKESADYKKLHDKLSEISKREIENQQLVERIKRDKVLLHKSNIFGVTMGLFAVVIIIAFFLIYLSRTFITGKPLLSVSFSEHEEDQRLQFTRRLSVVVCLLVIPILAHSILWGNMADIIAKVAFMVLMIVMHFLAIRRQLRAIFYAGLFLVYPITILPSALIGLTFALPLIPVTIFLVWNYLAQRPLEQILNAVVMAVNFILSYLVSGRLIVFKEENVETLDIMVSLMALLMILITLIYTNQLVYDSKEVIARNNRFLRQISDLNPHFVFAKDTSRRFIFTNNALADTFGKSNDDLLGKRDDEIHPIFSEDPQFMEDDLTVLEKGEDTFRSREKIYDFMGNEKWLETIKKPIFNEKNEIIGLLGVASDITDRIKAEDQLRKNEAMLNAIINSIPDPVLALRDNYTPIFYNNKLLTGFLNQFGKGLDAQPIWTDMFSPEIVDRYFQIFCQASKGEIVRVSDVFPGKDAVMYASLTFSPIMDSQGDNLGVVIIVQDETELKQKEIDLNRKNEQLKNYIESNMNLENFAYLASHDLRAPIRTIVSFAQLLEKRLAGVLSEEDREYLDFVVSASKNMQRLIHDLLTYSRVNTTKINIFPINLPQLLEELRNELFVTIEEKNAKLTFHSIPETISADRIKLRQLLSNLIINALKFSRPEVPPEIEISCKVEQDQWRFHVKDNGIGIPKEYQEHIFLLFRRLHKEADYEGTGIGLALCKKIIEQHKGEIGVISEKGKGSEFYFTIPVEKIELRLPHS